MLKAKVPEARGAGRGFYPYRSGLELAKLSSGPSANIDSVGKCVCLGTTSQCVQELVSVACFSQVFVA